MDLKLLPDTDPILRQVAAPVLETEFETEELWDLCKSMRRVMVENNGIGLAAPQVGVLKRIIVVDVGRPEVAIINPEIISKQGKFKYNEGCLSFPDLFLPVERAQTVVVRYQGIEGTWRECEAHNLHAVVFQHEIDHLNGIVFTDHVSPMQLALVRKKMMQKR